MYSIPHVLFHVTDINSLFVDHNIISDMSCVFCYGLLIVRDVAGYRVLFLSL